MTTIIRSAVMALATSLSLAFVSSAVANHPKALLVAPDPYCYDLPKFGFHSRNLHGIGEQITFVKWGGIASRMGLEPGDVVLGLNGFRLSYHGSWNDALQQAMYNGGWVQLTIRDVRTGRLAYRQTFVGSPGHGPITPKSHAVAYGPTTSHYVVGGGPITPKSKGGGTKHPQNFDDQLKKLAKLFKN